VTKTVTSSLRDIAYKLDVDYIIIIRPISNQDVTCIELRILSKLQGDVFMYIVGIDIGKYNHEATIIDETGTLIGKSIRFSNSHIGADNLIDYIIKNISQSDVTFGLEATGHYWLSLYSFLLDKGYTINVINPIQSDSFRNLYIRQTKNDTKDSFIIA
jgi:hypothetical protein